MLCRNRTPFFFIFASSALQKRSFGRSDAHLAQVLTQCVTIRAPENAANGAVLITGSGTSLAGARHLSHETTPNNMADLLARIIDCRSWRTETGFVNLRSGSSARGAQTELAHGARHTSKYLDPERSLARNCACPRKARLWPS